MAHIKRIFIILCQERWSYLIFIALAIFSISTLAGYSSGVAESRKVLEDLVNLMAPLKGLNSLWLTILIFFNNSLKAIATIFSGLALGIGPLAFLVINGALLGVVVKGVTLQHGAIITILSLLPHGILEIPSVILSAALGFHLGRVVLQKIRGRDSQIKKEIKLSLLLFAAIILPALLVAAFVEVFVTPLVVRIFLR